MWESQATSLPAVLSSGEIDDVWQFYDSMERIASYRRQLIVIADRDREPLAIGGGRMLAGAFGVYANEWWPAVVSAVSRIVDGDPPLRDG